MAHVLLIHIGGKRDRFQTVSVAAAKLSDLILLAWNYIYIFLIIYKHYKNEICWTMKYITRNFINSSNIVRIEDVAYCIYKSKTGYCFS